MQLNVRKANLTFPIPSTINMADTCSKKVFGSNILEGRFDTIADCQFRELENVVLGALKDTLLDHLDPKHHGQWETIAQKCCIGILNKMKVVNVTERGQSVSLKEDRKSDKAELVRLKKVEANFLTLLENVAKFYISQKEDNSPKELLFEIIQIVRGNTATGVVSMDKWNEGMMKVQLEAISREEQGNEESGKDYESSVQPSITRDSGTPTSIQTTKRSSSSNTSYPSSTSSASPSPSFPVSDTHRLPSALPSVVDTPSSTTTTTQPGSKKDSNKSNCNHCERESTKKKSKPVDKTQLIQISERAWKYANDINTTANASVIRLKYQDCEKRCKIYDGNPAIATAISLVEEEEQTHFAWNKVKKVGRASLTGGSAEDFSRRETILMNRLGYESASIFCEKLDIMQKIIKKYRDSEFEEEKDFLLKLICDSFSRDEVNLHILPPEAQVMAPGRVRNTSLISHHKWTELRRSAGCVLQTPMPAEAMREGAKKRKRKLEMKRLSASQQEAIV